MCSFKLSFTGDFCTLNQVVMVCSMSPASDLQIKDIMKPVLIFEFITSCFFSYTD